MGLEIDLCQCNPNTGYTNTLLKVPNFSDYGLTRYYKSILVQIAQLTHKCLFFKQWRN